MYQIAAVYLFILEESADIKLCMSDLCYVSSIHIINACEFNLIFS